MGGVPIGRGSTAAVLMLTLLALLPMAGCVSGSRTVTVSAQPADAEILIDGAERGRGSVTETLSFSNGRTYTVKVARLGFTDQVFILDGTPEQDLTHIVLKPRLKRVRFVVNPRLPAIIRVDGKALHEKERLEASVELEFSVDADGKWIPHIATAERPGYQQAEVKVRFDDASAVYTLNLDPVRKDVTIITDPPGAMVSIDGVPVGPSPVHRPGFVIGVDEVTNAWRRYRVRAEMPGHESAETTITYDRQTEYALKLPSLTPGSDEPPDPPHTKPTSHPATQPSTQSVKPPPATQPHTMPGTVPNRVPDTMPSTAPTQPVAPPVASVTATLKGFRPRWTRGPGGWTATPDEFTQSAPLKTDEPGGHAVRQIVRAAEGQTIGSLGTSGDGARLAYSVLTGDRLRLQSRIYVKRLDNDQSPAALTQGEHLDLMPMFAPGGGRVLFVSDRKTAGQFDVFAAPTAGGAVEAVVVPPPGVDAAAAEPAGTLWLWPMLDAAPQPRLYVERRAATGGEPRIVAVETKTGKHVDLGQVGVQPRVSPRADAIVFVRADLRTGKRDLFLQREGVAGAVNLTQSPDDDDYDPAWSKDGSRIAWTSDRALPDTTPANASHDDDTFLARDLNIWVMAIAKPQSATPITANSASDDAPAWSGDDTAVYFRSDRGGAWGIWRAPAPR